MNHSNFDDGNPLSGCAVVIELPVLWGDMDALGHVNNTIYLRWFESSRVAYLEQANLRHRLRASHIGPILAAVNCNFRRQIVYPDTVRLGTCVSRIGRTSMTMQHFVVNEKQQVAADGESVVVIFDYQTQRPLRVPDEIRQLVEQLEGRDLSS